MKYILIILLFASCNATKQAARDEKKSVKLINKAIKISRVTAAKVTRDTFPCTELFKTDTAVYVYDSLIYVECPDYNNYSEPKVPENDSQNTVEVTPVKGFNNVIKVPVQLPIRTQIVTRWYKDSTDVFLVLNDLDKASKEAEKYKGKSQRRGNLAMWLIIALAALTAITILTVRTLLTRSKKL